MYNRLMRTTIEMDDGHRAALLELAARRGEKGFSSLVREAIDVYLRSKAQEPARRRKALRTRGTLPAKETEALRRHAEAVRNSWR